MNDQPRSFLPVSGNVLPRFAGIPTFMRLPHIPVEQAKEAGVEIGLIGVPWDGGTTNRPGPRHGPRQVREMSALIRRFHGVTRVSPFEIARVADLGDAPANPVDLMRALETIGGFARSIVEAGATPLAVGGDHLISLPLLRAAGAARPLGMMAAIGRHNGVAEVLGVGFSGLPAWLLWRAYYLSQMPTLRRKLRLWVEWTWGMFFPADITHLRFTRSTELPAHERGSGV